MAMVDVDSGSLYSQTHSLSHLAWSCFGGRLAPFYILKWTGWTLAMALPWWQRRKHCLEIIIIIIIIIQNDIVTQMHFPQNNNKLMLWSIK